MNDRKEKLNLIGMMALYHDAQLPPAKAEIYLQDFEGFSVETLQQAWKSYRMNISNGNRMPTPAQLLCLVDDGRPSANTAWAMIPQNEEASCVWSDEMAQAWRTAYPHLKNGNQQSAFFTFKENYERMVQENRANKIKPKWTPSFGFDKSGREDAVIKAVQQKFISIEMAQKFCPEIEFNPQFANLLSYEQKLQLGHNEPRKQEIKSLVSSLTKKEW